MVMARPLPAKVENTPPELSRQEELILDALASGLTPAQIARKIAPNDPKKRKAWRQRLRRLVQQPVFQQALAADVKAELILATGSSVKALNRKARAGRVDAIKLAFEASGFHNPRTEVNHSGEVQITIKGLPRPERVEDEPTVVDAEVVD